jgi:hypothetical protein
MGAAAPDIGFRKDLAEGLPDHIVLADAVEIGAVGEEEAQVGPRDHRHEARRAVEQAPQPFDPRWSGGAARRPPARSSR